MSKHNEVSLKEAIEQLIDSYKIKPKLQESQIIEFWEHCMGKTIAKHTKEIYLRNKKLFLQIDNAPLKQELLFGRDKVIKLINEKLGDEVIEDIVIM